MHSKRYQEIKKQVASGKKYSLAEAVDILKKNSKAKFNEGVEIHLNLGIDPKKGEQQIRGAVTLPHGTGKTRRIAAFTNAPEKAKAAGAIIAGGQELIDEIKKTEKTDFDVAVAETSIMKSLAQIAKILGTRGLMPSPKTGTVSDDIEAAVKALVGGKVNFKNDDTGNLHQLVGRISFENKQLVENIQTFLDTVKKMKPSGIKGDYIRSVTLCTTMGPGIRIAI